MVRNVKTFLRDISSKPPLLLSLTALFHVFALLYTLWNAHTEPFPSIIWLQPLWMLLYTICWLYICDLKKWAAWGYLIITSVNIIVLLAIKSADMRELATNAIFPIDILFSFFVLFYYKRFQ